MKTQTLIIGAGLAGMVTALELAKQGHHVLLLDANKQPGGRAMSHHKHGLMLNQGPHALYLKGHLNTWLQRNNIPVSYTIPPNNNRLDWANELFEIPQRPDQLWRARWLKGGRWEATQTLIKMLTARDSSLSQLSATQWIDQQCTHEATQAFIQMLLRLTCYTGQLESLNAYDALRQFQLGAKGVGYVHHGWQMIVDVLSKRIEGEPHIELRCTQGVVSVDRRDGAWHAQVRRGGSICANHIVLAMSPHKAIRILRHPRVDEIATHVHTQPPSTVATLDLIMRAGTAPQLVLGTTTPFYFSNVTQTTPMGEHGKAAPTHQLWQMVHYNPNQTSDTKQTLLQWLDRHTPNWRAHCEDMIFRPKMQTSAALVAASAKPIPTRWFEGLYCAGDGVGKAGMLADRSVASALEVVEHLTQNTSRYNHAS